MNSLNEFYNYVYDFYNHDSDLYPIKGLTMNDIMLAFKVYRKRIKEAESNNGRWFNVTYQWGGGDTLDRERVRDIILEQPQFSFGG